MRSVNAFARHWRPKKNEDKSWMQERISAQAYLLSRKQFKFPLGEARWPMEIEISPFISPRLNFAVN